MHARVSRHGGIFGATVHWIGNTQCVARAVSSDIIKLTLPSARVSTNRVDVTMCAFKSAIRESLRHGLLLSLFRKTVVR